MSRIDDIDIGRTYTRNPRAPNFSVPQWVQQNRKTCEMQWMPRDHAGQGNLILELAQVSAGRNDRRMDAQHMKTVAICAAIVAQLDDVALPYLFQRPSELIMPLLLQRTHDIEE